MRAIDWRLPLAAATALIATSAHAHDLAPPPLREMVRIQGYRAPAPASETVVRSVTFLVLGQQVPFAANEWRVFAFFDPTTQPTPSEAPQVSLQGERALLHRVASARADQRVTILAERRPGASDVFVLSVDVCPP